MKKVSLYLVAFTLLTGFVFSLSYNAVADGHAVGMGIYEESCASCHQDNMAGMDEASLLEKFHHFETGDFTAGPAKIMKDIFMGLSEEEKVSLAHYINVM